MIFVGCRRAFIFHGNFAIQTTQLQFPCSKGNSQPILLSAPNEDTYLLTTLS